MWHDSLCSTWLIWRKLFVILMLILIYTELCEIIQNQIVNRRGHSFWKSWEHNTLEKRRTASCNYACNRRNTNMSASSLLKKDVVAHFSAKFRHIPGCTEKKPRNASVRVTVFRDKSEPKCPAYEAGVLLPRSMISVFQIIRLCLWTVEIYCKV